ncbi:unnamed protein product [Prorocentrum cordatum]|uniref:Uncharacterized protein n=1 Tax=Prorocentrum cordatum TaxID=2364126 RepID=A0ABN9Y7P9_9DINO|nr:unnamed protein product [Polarella glacialis]
MPAMLLGVRPALSSHGTGGRSQLKISMSVSTVLYCLEGGCFGFRVSFGISFHSIRVTVRGVVYVIAPFALGTANEVSWQRHGFIEDAYCESPPHQMRAALAALVEGLGFQCPFSWHSCRRGGASEWFLRTKRTGLTLVRGRWASSLTARIYVEDALANLARVQRGDAQATLVRQWLGSLRIFSELP